MRDSGDSPFTDDDVRFLHELAPALAALIRNGHRSSPPAPLGAATLPPGTLILDAELRPASWTPGVRAWLGDLQLAPGADALPPVVFELGARTLTPPETAHGLAASVRIRTRSGRWATLEGARLEGAVRGRAAITFRHATVDEIFDFVAKAHDFTRRERQLVALVLDGLGTKQLAAALCISPHTVQDHLKGIFAKTRVRTRRELVAHLAGR
jgi:DNA-binding CsgD family transcriptional regulator